MSAERRLAALAARQHGLATLRQLETIGFSRSAIDHRLATGRLHRTHRGVFAVGHRSVGERAVLLAAVMACGGDSALSHVHAGHLLALFPPWEEILLTPTHVTVPPGSARGRRPGLIVHRMALPAAEVMVRDAIPVTTVARTILDLAAMLGPRGTERAIDQAVTDRKIKLADLHEILERHPGRAGAAPLRALLAAGQRSATASRSEMEEEFLELIRGAGIRDPHLNFRLAGMKIDAAWPLERVGVELDGYTWHRSRFRQESDRNREARLRGLGWVPVRYSWRQVFQEPLAIVADISSILRGRRA